MIKIGNFVPTPEIEGGLGIEDASRSLYTLKKRGLVIKRRGRAKRPVRIGFLGMTRAENRRVNLWYITEEGYDKTSQILQNNKVLTEINLRFNLNINLGDFNFIKIW